MNWNELVINGTCPSKCAIDHWTNWNAPPSAMIYGTFCAAKSFICKAGGSVFFRRLNDFLLLSLILRGYALWHGAHGLKGRKHTNCCSRMILPCIELVVIYWIIMVMPILDHWLLASDYHTLRSSNIAMAAMGNCQFIHDLLIKNCDFPGLG